MKRFNLRCLVYGIGLAFILSFFPLSSQAAFLEADSKININTAETEELQELPRVGPKIAERIIQFRETHGEFKKIEEIMKVRGIGENTFNKIKDKITVGNTGQSR